MTQDNAGLAGDEAFIKRLVSCALHPQLVGNLRVTETVHTDVATDNVVRIEYALADAGGSVPLGDTDDLAAAFRKLARVFGTAMDQAVEASKDTRIVELYKAYKAVPDSERILNALWLIMTPEEQGAADISRAFDSGSLDAPEELPDCDPHKGAYVGPPDEEYNTP
jgi:hypothetical protein